MREKKDRTKTTDHRIFRILKKIIIISLLVLISLPVIGYISLWIYASTYTQKISEETLHSYTTASLTEHQAQLIWFTAANNRNYGFTYYPFLFDIFLKPPRDNIDVITASDILYKQGVDYDTSIKMYIAVYATYRYINRRFNWKDCLEFLVSISYMGNEIFGIEDASNHFYNKPFSNLSDREIIGLSLIMFRSPYKYSDVESEDTKALINAVYEEFNQKQF